MLAFVATVLFTTLPRPAPLPDAKGIDAVTFHLGPGGCFQAYGALVIKSDGKVSYFRQFDMCQNHMDPVHKKEWEIPAKEAAFVIRNLVDAGLLALPKHGGLFGVGVARPFGSLRAEPTFTVSSGRWQAGYFASPIPEKLMAVMLPLLEKAHPELWKAKPSTVVPKPRPPALTYLEYSYLDIEAGHLITISASRGGYASFSRRDAKAPVGTPALKHGQLEFFGVDTEAKLLDALYAAGIADMKEDSNPTLRHHFDLRVDDWRLTINPKELPEPILKILQPLLDKAALPAPKQ